MNQEEAYMWQAIELARRGEGHTSPNPMVGCVIVKNGNVIGEGWHERCGENHAERNALLNCTEDPSGADLYVTLEPCCHQGKTPPCTDIIIEKKIARVFVGSEDPNPLVAGKGIRILQDHGIEVQTGILEKECTEMNEIFFSYITKKRPFVVMKYAMTLDGKIACESGDSKWVTNELSREYVHHLRRRYAGIMVGISTVLKDDPMLNCRIEEGVDPVRIICDSKLRIPMDSAIVRTAREIPTIVACTNWGLESGEKAEKKTQLEAAGVRVLPVKPLKPDKEEEQIGRVYIDLDELMRILAEEGIDSILLEGGAELNGTAVKLKIVNKVYAFVAAKIVGGRKSPTAITGEGVQSMADAMILENTSSIPFGSDMCIIGYPVYS